MKVIGIIGSRRRNHATDVERVHLVFESIYQEGDEIVSGGCSKGGDAFAYSIARKCGIPIKIYFPDWSKGMSAGFERNSYIAHDATVLIACVADDRKGGTEDTITKFQRLKPENLVYLV